MENRKDLVHNFTELKLNHSFYAHEFSEGNIYLEKLLDYCFVNDISTVSCCRGHDNSMAYIYFAVSQEKRCKFDYIIHNLINNNKIKYEIKYEIKAVVPFPEFNKKLGILIKFPRDIADKCFENILKDLKSGKTIIDKNIFNFMKIVNYFQFLNISYKDCVLSYDKGTYWVQIMNGQNNLFGCEVSGIRDYKYIDSVHNINDIGGWYNVSEDEIGLLPERVLRLIKK